jgi:hypothetical protein
MDVEDDFKDDPVIMTSIGGSMHRVTPWARRQAVLNMRRDPKKLAEMIAMFGEERLRRDFPEAFIKDDDETQA